MAVNKVVYGGSVIIDLTSDTATKDKVLKNFTFHDKSGALQTGSCTFDVNSQDATAAVGEILQDRSAYARGVKLSGTMPNNGAVAGTISTKAGQYTVPQGYHDGSGKVGISSTEQAKLIPANIREGITILGVVGEMSGSEAESKQDKTVTPTKDGFTVLPDDGYTCLSQVVVNPIPYVETPNAAGGTTVTIG